MTVLPVSEIDVKLGRLDQRSGQKQVLPGALDLCENAHQIEDGVFEKRDGYSPLNTTTDTGSITSASDLGIADGELTLVSQDAVYRRDSTQAKWINGGEHRPAFATYETATNVGGYRPSFCVDSQGNRWFFSATNRPDGTTSVTDRRPQVRVVDSAGREIVALKELTSAFTVETGKCISVGDFVYFIYVTGKRIRYFKFSATAPSSTPTNVGDFLNLVATATAVTGLDVRVSGSTVVVAIWGNNLNGTNAAVVMAYLDTATNAPAASPGAVYSNFSDNKEALNAGCLLVNNQLAGVVSHRTSGVPETDKLEAFTVNASTLACTFHTIATGLLFREYSALCGRDNTTTWSVWRGGDAGPGFLHDPTFDVVRAYTVTVSGWTATSSVVARGAWLVADPAVIGSKVYLVVGHEDVLVTSPGVQSQQRSFSLIDGTTGLVLARAMYEVGGGDIDGQAGGFSFSGFIAPVRVNGTAIEVCVGACRDGLMDFYSVLLTWETAPALGPGFAVGDGYLLPGGYPVRLSKDGALDSAPQFYPPLVSVTATADGGANCPDATYQVCATYVVIASNGDEVESQPSTVMPVTTASQFIRAVVGNLRQVSLVPSLARGSKTYIRLYTTTDAATTLYRQSQVMNDPTGDVTTIDLRLPGVGAPLYTEGGVIENTAPPPFRAGCYANGRALVTGLAEKGVVYESKLMVAGKLPEFFDGGRFNVGPVRCYAVCAVDRNYTAVFTETGIAYIDGPGPNALGGDARLPKWIKGTQTTTNPRSVCETPIGCPFQGRDGGIYLLDSNLQVNFIGRGVDDFRSSIVTGVVHMPKQQQIRFSISSGEILVFDYGRKPMRAAFFEDTLGQWYVWRRAGGLSPVHAAVLSDVHHVLTTSGIAWKQVDGQVFDNASEFIPMKLRLPLTFRGVAGFFRLLRAVFVGTWLAAHKIRLTLQSDTTTTVLAAKDLTSLTPAWDVRPRISQASTFVLTIEEQQSAGSPLNKAFKFEGLSLEVQTQPGGRRTRVRMAT